MALEVQWIPDRGRDLQTHCPSCEEKLLFPGYDEEKVEKFYSEDDIMELTRLTEKVRVGASIFNTAIRCSHCGHAYLSSQGGGIMGEGWSLRLTFRKD